MMRRGFVGAAILILCAGMVLSCSKRYVGQSVGYTGDQWCHYSENINDGVEHCTISTEWVEFDFQISKADKAGEYLIKGTMDLSKGEGRNAAIIDEAKTRFFMLVASEGVVVDNVGFRPVYIGNVRSKIPFSVNYVRKEGFSMVTFGYNIMLGV